MPSFIHYVLVLMILCQYTDEVWSSNLHKQKYYGFAKHASSEEDLNNGFRSSNTPYYNSREAHGDSLDIVDANSAEDLIEETPGSISTILEGYLNKSEVNKYPYPLRIGSHESYKFSKYDPDTVKINLDISDYLEALSDKKVSVNKYIEPHNIRKNYGQAQSGVIFAEHSYFVPLSNSHLPKVDSIESKEDLTDNINTKSVYEHNFSTESKELSSQEIVAIYSSDTDSVKYVLDLDSLESKQDLTDNVNTKSLYEQIFSTESKEVSSPEIFGIYSSDTDSVKYVELGSAESSETTESWALLAQGQTRIRPGVPQDFPSTEVSLPLCSGSKPGNKQNQCRKEQNFCRSTGDCRITRIWGTCCNSPGCGTYCKPNKSKCPHPNSLAETCNITSDEHSETVCSTLRNNCSMGRSCCQTPCGSRCV